MFEGKYLAKVDIDYGGHGFGSEQTAPDYCEALKELKKSINIMLDFEIKKFENPEKAGKYGLISPLIVLKATIEEREQPHFVHLKIQR